MKNQFLIILLLFLVPHYAIAQNPTDATAEELTQLVQKAKTTYELEKLNDIRIRLRNIEFARLTDRNRQELYAEAYRQLAIAHRNNKYIRPGYEIYQKYISLKDSLAEREYKHRRDSVVQFFENKIAEANQRVDSINLVKSKLNVEYNSMENLRTNYMSYCTMITIVLAAVFFFFYSSLTKKIKYQLQVTEDNRSKLQSVYDDHTRCRMFAGLVTQMIVLNNRMKENHAALLQSFDSVQESLKDLKETSSLLKQFKDDDGRLEKLIEINNNTLHPFITS